MGLQHGSENENDEDIDDSGSGGADYERNTCKSAFNDFLSIVYYYHCLFISTTQLDSLSSTATTALIYPKEIDTITCDADSCNIKDLKGKDIHWCSVIGCDSLHSFAYSGKSNHTFHCSPTPMLFLGCHRQFSLYFANLSSSIGYRQFCL